MKTNTNIPNFDYKMDKYLTGSNQVQSEWRKLHSIPLGLNKQNFDSYQKISPINSPQNKNALVLKNGNFSIV